MSIWSWLKLTAALWLLRKSAKAFGWLLITAAAIAAWPLTAVAAIGCLAAWLRGWPPARLWHAAAWALPMTAVYAIGQALRLHAWQAVALAPVDDWGQAWRLLAGHAMLRAALLVAPVAVPAGLAAGGALWAWRIYAITTGLAGHSPASPVLFDERQWRRQACAALGRVTAPGAVPLLNRPGPDRDRGHDPRDPAPLAARAHPARHRPDAPFGARRFLRQREDEPDDAAVGGLVCRRPRLGHRAGVRRARCWPRWTARADPTRASKPDGPAACCTAWARGGWRSGPMRRGCRCGCCRPATCPFCCSR